MSLLGQFFFTKRFHTHKKHKNAYKQTKAKKAAFFMCLKTSKGEKVIYIFKNLFLCLQNLFVKKLKEFKTALVTSFTLLLSDSANKFSVIYYVFSVQRSHNY